MTEASPEDLIPIDLIVTAWLRVQRMVDPARWVCFNNRSIEMCRPAKGTEKRLLIEPFPSQRSLDSPSAQ